MMRDKSIVTIFVNMPLEEVWLCQKHGVTEV